MGKARKLPDREHAFMASLQYHGFRRTSRRHNLKLKRGYVIPATPREDSVGIDLWIKMPRDSQLFPIQITQRGVHFYKKHQGGDRENLALFLAKAEERLKIKRERCYRDGIAFVLVADHTGARTNHRRAWGDIKALRHAITHLKRRLI